MSDQHTRDTKGRFFKQQYLFSVPTLPKEWYLKVQELRGTLRLSNWQMVILGFRLICELGQRDSIALLKVAREVAETYPLHPYKEPRQPQGD